MHNCFVCSCESSSIPEPSSTIPDASCTIHDASCTIPDAPPNSVERTIQSYDDDLFSDTQNIDIM